MSQPLKSEYQNDISVKNITELMTFLNYDKYEVPSSGVSWPEHIIKKYGEDPSFYFNKHGCLLVKYVSKYKAEDNSPSSITMYDEPKQKEIIDRCFFNLVDETATKVIKMESDRKIPFLSKLILQIHKLQFIEKHCYLNSYSI